MALTHTHTFTWLCIHTPIYTAICTLITCAKHTVTAAGSVTCGDLRSDGLPGLCVCFVCVCVMCCGVGITAVWGRNALLKARDKKKQSHMPPLRTTHPISGQELQQREPCFGVTTILFWFRVNSGRLAQW